MSKKITTTQIWNEVQRLAAAEPERVYIKPIGYRYCSYHDSLDQPGRGCLIGEAMKNLGVEIPVDLFDEVADAVLVLDIHVDESLEKLIIAQSVQDSGNEWGKAISIAERYAEEENE